MDEAEKSLSEALRLKPDFANEHCNLGVVLDDLGRFEKPRRADARRCASNRRMRSLMPISGTYSFISGVAVKPSRAMARHCACDRTSESGGGLGEALLLAGQFEEGWKEFGQAWLTERLAGWRPLLGVPVLEREAIWDRVILLLAESGLGDALQFCRHVPQVACGAPGWSPRQTGLAVEPLRHLLAMAAKSRRQSLISVAAPVSPTHPRRMAERDQPGAERLAAPG
jgi:hypothetical protein